MASGNAFLLMPFAQYDGTNAQQIVVLVTPCQVSSQTLPVTVASDNGTTLVLSFGGAYRRSLGIGDAVVIVDGSDRYLTAADFAKKWVATSRITIGP